MLTLVESTMEKVRAQRGAFDLLLHLGTQVAQPYLRLGREREHVVAPARYHYLDLGGLSHSPRFPCALK
jgi:hypothetical protein